MHGLAVWLLLAAADAPVDGAPAPDPAGSFEGWTAPPAATQDGTEPPPAATPQAQAEPPPAAPDAAAAPREEVLDGWLVPGVVGGATAGLLLLLATPLLVPLVCVAPVVMPLAGVVAGATAWMSSWALNRRAPLGGMVLAGAAVGFAGGLAVWALAGAGGMMAFAALSNSGPPVWFGLAAAAVFAVAGVAWVMAAVLGAGLTAVLAGPCSRGLMPGERALNVDLLGAPSPEEVLPNWLRRLEVAPPGAIPPAPVAPSPAPAPDAEGHTAEEPLAD